MGIDNNFMQKLKEMGVDVISTQRDTIIQVKIQGLAGKKLLHALRHADRAIASKVHQLVENAKKNNNGLFLDPVFGPTEDDAGGAAAICTDGLIPPATGASRHQLKTLKLIKESKIRWERPSYSEGESEGDNQDEYGSDEDEYSDSAEHPFSQAAVLFEGGSSSGDVIQGNLGDCWFLGALSVLATRADLVEQIFWRGDKYKENGLFVCRFMKDFVWNYVIIDDQIPVYGYNGNKAGKPFFARCKNPDELWVSLIEKAYAKLHGNYEALIGGYIDVALNDLSGLCSEQIIMKEGHPGFGEDPFAPTKKSEGRGDAFWKKLLAYRDSGSLMGCSIQPLPVAGKKVTAEANAGQGLHFKHAYGLVDAGEITTTTGQSVRLVKLRNPWGMGEWSGAWSDSSNERLENENAIHSTFQKVSRNVGGNALKKIAMEQNPENNSVLEQVEVTEVNRNDGTFFMQYEDWIQFFSHFFAGIDFPDTWIGTRVEGVWDQVSCGGNTTKQTWRNNPRKLLSVHERCNLFISVSQDDPRGKATDQIIPIGFHICSATPVDPNSTALDFGEPPGKNETFYRLYSSAARDSYLNGVQKEPIPPAIIPGTVITDVDEDGVPQPSYTFKQAVSIRLCIEPGEYFIVPSMYMRKNKKTGAVNTGKFWISVYGDRPAFELEDGSTISEEAEGDEKSHISASPLLPTTKPIQSAPDRDISTSIRFEDVKDELMAQALRKNIGFREVKREFDGPSNKSLEKLELKRKLLNLGFKLNELSDAKLNILISGVDKDKSGSISNEEVLQFFINEMEEDRILAQQPPKEDQDDVLAKPNRHGVLSVTVESGKDLVIPAESDVGQLPVLEIPRIRYSEKEKSERNRHCQLVLDENPELLSQLPYLQIINIDDPVVLRKTLKELKNRSIRSVPGAVADLEAKIDQSILNEKNSTDLSLDTTHLSSQPFERRTGQDSKAGDNDLNLEVPRSLHISERMKSLEEKRSTRFKRLKRVKQQAFGDKEKLSQLPRLVGGLKSGSGGVDCEYCGVYIENPITENTCQGPGCIEMFCGKCWGRLPTNRKYCETCFQHEGSNVEILGIQLREMLVRKLGGAVQLKNLREQFEQLDQDKSGSLSREEFVNALHEMQLHPSLSDNQITELLHQFDQNNDGLINFEEFQRWLCEDQAWEPTLEVITEAEGQDYVPEIIDAIIGRIHEASVLRSHSVPTYTSSEHAIDEVKSGKAVVPEEDEGVVCFQRILPILTSYEAEDDESESSGIQSIFEKFDVNEDGQIQFAELKALLQELGYEVEDSDVSLLMQALDSENGDGTISLEEFSDFIDPDKRRISRKRSLIDLLSEITTALREHSESCENVLAALLVLDPRMPKREMFTICESLGSVNVTITTDEVERLAIAFSMYQESTAVQDVEGDDEEKTSNLIGENLISVLRELIQKSDFPILTIQIEDIATACSTVAFGDERSGRKLDFTDDELSHLWLVIACSQNEVSQASFVSSIAEVLTAEASSSALPLWVQVGLLIDNVRCCHGIQYGELLSKKAFFAIIRHEKFIQLKNKIQETLRNLNELVSGQQLYLVSVSIVHSNRVLVRAYDPILRREMNVICTEETQVIESLPFLGKQNAETNDIHFTFERQSSKSTTREKRFEANPNGLINSACFPKLDAAICSLCSRLQLHRQQSTGSFLMSLKESDNLVHSIRTSLSSVPLPFFSSVSPQKVEFSVDARSITKQVSVNDFIVQEIGKYPALKAYLSGIRSILRVYCIVIGSAATSSYNWVEFTAYLRGLRHPYACVELSPYDESFRTPVKLGGGANPNWNFHHKLSITPPTRCTERTDRAAVFMDVLQINNKPDPDGQKLIQLLSTVRKPTADSSFVVLSVRRTIPSAQDEIPRLYCTAYDPTTACDYEVLGYPDDWSVDFFDTARAESDGAFQRKWEKMVQAMRLGKNISPKMTISVYNQAKCDQVIGICEIPITSLLASEGQILGGWFSVYNQGKHTGYVKIRAQFDMNVVSSDPKSVNQLTTTIFKEPLPIPTKVQEIEKPKDIREKPSTEKNTSKEDEKMRQENIKLQQEVLKLKEAHAQTARRAQKLEHQLKTQQSAPAQQHDTESSNWRRKYDRLKKQASDQQAEYEAAMKRMEAKIQHVPTENDSQLAGCSTAQEILSSMKSILLGRCKRRPYNALKKAMVAVTDLPDKIDTRLFDDLLADFGLDLSRPQQEKLLALLDPENTSYVSIEEFLSRLAGEDGAAYSRRSAPKDRSELPKFESKESMIDFLRENLPSGWEMKVNDSGRPYFLDHSSRKSQWNHPVAEVADIYSKMAEAEKLQRRLSRGSSNSPRNRS